ncbi:hypothetical protein ACQV88_26605, partial [Ralstonia pseudosolanacearum]|uniref:hypothetical protein n=1 Tax=Ralstonia pseudosolanacearum TaxID=1310165 RepID=UPI003D2898A2
GAFAALFAAVVALWIANRDRTDRAREKNHEQAELKAIVEAILKPEYELLLFNLRQIYVAMWRIRHTRGTKVWKAQLERISWLNEKIGLPATDRLLNDLPVLGGAVSRSYSAMFGSITNLKNAVEQFKICPRNHPHWTNRFEMLELFIGLFADRIARAHEIPRGDLRMDQIF